MKINPYIAGNPVGGGDAFIGRADVLREVLRVLRSPGENALVLYGQRRIGKTSVLQELVARLPKAGLYQPVFFDLQDKAVLLLAQVVQDLATNIREKLGLSPSAAWGEDAPRAFREEFIPQFLANLSDDTSLVLLFDEFDVLDNPGEAQAGATFFPYLRNLLSLNPRLQFVFVIGHRPEDLSSLTLSVFKGVKSYSVSLMLPEETASLTFLAERNGTLYWTDEAVTRVYNLTGGHPFLTQQLCQQIWEQAYDDEPEEPPTVTPAEVEAAVSATLRSANNALEWLWDGLKPAQRIVASALAEARPEAISQDELNQRMLNSGVRILIGELQDAPHVLQEWDLIAPVRDGYRFRVELLRRWIAERKPLARVQEEIDRIQPVADNLFQAAYNLYQGGQLEQAIPLLRQAIGFNPNHLRANQLLAEILLAQSELTEARQLLESLYQHQPAAARPRLVQVLLFQARKTQDEQEQLALYERVLQFEPGQPEAKAGRRPILQQKLIELQQAGEYQTALELAQQLHKNYPEEQDRLPDLGLLERKTRLDDLYQRALGALQTDDRATAQKLLIEVVQLELNFREATRYLHLAVTGVDVVEVQAQLEQERKARQQQAEVTAQEQAQALQKYELEVSRLRDELEVEKKARERAEAEVSAQLDDIYDARLTSFSDTPSTNKSEYYTSRRGPTQQMPLSVFLENREKARQQAEVAPQAGVKAPIAERKQQGKKPSYWKAIGFHLLFGFGLFYVDKNLKRKWIYPVVSLFPSYVILSLITGGWLGFDLSGLIIYVPILIFLVIYALSFIDVIWTCRNRRKKFVA